MKIPTFLLLLFLFAGSTLSLQAEAPEKDREAILAMAGEYDVAFNFRETIALSEGYKLKSEYQEDAAELVIVTEDTGDRIALQHILLVGESRIVKHWKQIWTYEDTRVVHFMGRNDWEIRELSAEEAKGTWTQLVTQVDDSPRYESQGTWTHENGFSYWESQPTPRPLPRREHTKRSDYQVMLGINRHTITPKGWVHEQDNLKQVLKGDGGHSHFLTREAGINYYDRLEPGEYDFSPARDYWKETQGFWSQVTQVWEDIMSERDDLHMNAKVDGQKQYERLFEIAGDEELRAEMTPEKTREVILEFLKE